MEATKKIEDLNFDFEHFVDDIYFAKYLRFKKYFDDATFTGLRNIQELSNKKLGELAVEKNLLNKNQVDSIYDECIRSNKFFGQIAIEKNLISQEKVEELIALQKNNYISISEILLNFGYIRPEKIEEEMTIFKENNFKSNKQIEEKINLINFMNLKLLLDTILVTLNRILLFPPRLTSMIQPTNVIYSLDKLYKLTLTSRLRSFDLYFNYDEKIVNEVFIYKFRSYKNKRILKLRNAIPQEISNILTGVILKNLSDFGEPDMKMSVPYIFTDTKIDLPNLHYRFPITTSSGKMELILETTPKNA